MTIDLKKYVEFVDVTTSQPSKQYSDFTNRLQELESNEIGRAHV